MRILWLGGQLISRVVDFDSEDDSMYILPSISSELDRRKDLYKRLPELLTKVVEKELNRIPRCLRRGMSGNLWSIVYVPQVGYLIQVLGSPLGAEILDILDDYEQVCPSNRPRPLKSLSRHSRATQTVAL